MPDSVMQVISDGDDVSRSVEDTILDALTILSIGVAPRVCLGPWEWLLNHEEG